MNTMVGNSFFQLWHYRFNHLIVEGVRLLTVSSNGLKVLEATEVRSSAFRSGCDIQTGEMIHLNTTLLLGSGRQCLRR